MRAVTLLFLSLFLLTSTAIAQQADRANTILVLDASGSMWGQIDGVNKVVIARNVIADLLADMPDETSLGLTVYGHRERGSCSDIETIVPPAPFTQERILEAVNTINPRGRTPMTDSVVAAAQALRHTEEAATVILVSDGIENCNPDPCAFAAELEAAGVDFTAHVIGFDVASEPEARAQMQCIAENTGGQFLTADTASELALALERVVAAPTPVATQLQARVMPGNTAPTRPVTWTILAQDGTVLRDGITGTDISADLIPGGYVARATRMEPAGPVPYQTAFTVVDTGQTPVLVTMPEIVETVPVSFTARVEPDMTVPGSPLNWTLFDATDVVLLGPVEAPGGNVQLLPGEYRLQVERVREGTLHEAAFTITAGQPREVIVPLPALLVDITFSARLDSADGPVIPDPILWGVTPLEATLDAANPYTLGLSRGAYRVTAYWTTQEVEQNADFVVVDQPREIVLIFEAPLPAAVLTAPGEAVAGSTIEVGWDGPGEEGDLIGITAPGEDGYYRFANEAGVAEGSPLRLLMPTEPGDYVIEYARASDRLAIGTAPITLSPAEGSLTAPASAVAGQEIEVAWTGPGYDGDAIGVTTPGDTGYYRFSDEAPVTEGAPLRITMPTAPGEYVIEYAFGQDRRMLTSVPISVTEVMGSLTAPASATAGAEIEVGWTGPGYQGDVIGITTPGDTGYYRFSDEAPVTEGSPLRITMPTAPGEYVIEYALGQDRSALTSVPISVTAVSGSLTAPASAPAGAEIEVGWTGPGYDGDAIGVTTPGDTGYYRFSDEAPVTEGAPLRITMPTTPGDYVIEYALGQDRSVLTSVPISVTELAASLTAPGSAPAGSTIDIGWTGPGYDGDAIGVTTPGDTGYYRFSDEAPVGEGSPLRIVLPTTPGAYVIEYAFGQDRSVLTSAPIELTPVSASLTAPATANKDGVIEVGWTGPGYDGDFIGIVAVGAEGYYRFSDDVPVSEGATVRLDVPTDPGVYMIQYVFGQDRTALAEVPITIE